jgi:acyl dehydratase
VILNKYELEDIKIGMEASYSQTITDSDIRAFSGLSGDKNPLHMDDEYAKATIYKDRIAHGMISASFFSSLFGTKIPGEGSVYVAQSLHFKRPVYINDTVTATITVIRIDIKRRRVFFRTVCRVKNKTVIDGQAELYVL